MTPKNKYPFKKVCTGYLEDLASFITQPILILVTCSRKSDCYLVDGYLLKFRFRWKKEKSS